MAFSKIEMRKTGIRKLKKRIRQLEKHGYDVRDDKRRLERVTRAG